MYSFHAFFTTDAKKSHTLLLMLLIVSHRSERVIFRPSPQLVSLQTIDPYNRSVEMGGTVARGTEASWDYHQSFFILTYLSFN